MTEERINHNSTCNNNQKTLINIIDNILLNMREGHGWERWIYREISHATAAEYKVTSVYFHIHGKKLQIFSKSYLHSLPNIFP